MTLGLSFSAFSYTSIFTTALMAGFHLPGDPYFPDGWNDGWNEDELEPVPEIVAPVVEPQLEQRGEAEVENPRYPIRNMDDPLPPPGFQIYQHPGGPRWRNTPRKRVRPVRVREQAPTNQPPQEPLPLWARNLVEEAQATKVRLQKLSDHYQHMTMMVDVLQAERGLIWAENLTLQEQLANMEQRVQEAERQARLALDEVQKFRDRLPNA